VVSDILLYIDSPYSVLNIEEFLDWVESQTQDSLRAFNELLPLVILQLEIRASLLPRGLGTRMKPVLCQLKSLCE
jgi:hypothetical protein